jgi:hypothetical protein
MFWYVTNIRISERFRVRSHHFFKKERFFGTLPISRVSTRQSRRLDLFAAALLTLSGASRVVKRFPSLAMPSLFLALFLLLSILPNANALFFDFTASLRLAEGDVAAPASLIAEARQHMAFASLPYLHSNRLEGCFEDPEKEVCESIKLQGIGDVTWFKPGGGYPSKDAKAYDALIFTWTGDKKKGVERIVLSFKGSDNVQMWDFFDGLERLISWL